MIEHGRSDWPREGPLLRRADDQDLPGRLDHLPCHHPEAVQLSARWREPRPVPIVSGSSTRASR